MTKKIIAFQGSFGANSNIACTKFYPEFETKAFQSFEDVFLAVENGEVDLGMIPLENSSAGRVSEIYDLLRKSNVFIIAENFLKIEHNLVAINDAKLEDLKDVYSHPQALSQCRNNLRNLNLNVCEFSNTAQAAKFIASQNDKSKAAICSKEAAKINDLKIIKENLQDFDENATVFIIISKKPSEIKSEEKNVISFLMFTIKNYSGALYKSLGSFANNDVDMLQIESFIRGGASKQSVFFVIISGHYQKENVALALKDLEKNASDIKVFGSYFADKARY